MNQRVSRLLATASVVALAACANDSTSPTDANLRVSSQSSVASSRSSFIITLRDSRFAAEVSMDVAALGGSVTFVHPETGLMVVNGLSEASASTLGGKSGVQEVSADALFKIEKPLSSTKEPLVEESPLSQANPAGAVLYAFQWNMRLIGANLAWAAGKLGNAAVTVAIIDSGMDYDNRDLTGLVDLSRSMSFVPKDDSITTAFFPTRNKIDDYNGHGTNVATQVSSKAFAFAGVTSRTTLIGVKVIDWDGKGNLGRTLAGILWAADHGANVANLSVGGAFLKAGAKGTSSIVQRVMNYAKQKGMLIVVAAGNGSEDLDHDSSQFTTYCNAVHVICVSAVGPKTAMLNQDEPSFFTNFGVSAINVAAPGGNADAANGFPPSLRPWGNDIASWVWSFCARRSLASLTEAGVPVLAGCQGGGTVTGQIGTSQASPHVAGLAALLMAEGLSLNATRNAIMSSADDLGPLGPDPFYGRGRINVARALGL